VTGSPTPRLLPEEVLRRGRVVAILRASTGEHLRAAATTLVREGVRCLEVTTNTPGALATVRALRDELPADEACLGVGTVRTVGQVDQAADAGASFVVSPGTNASVGRRAAERGLRWYPGAATATEVETAWELGATAVKIFPAGSLGGPAFLRALRGPLDDVPFIPTGGVEVADVDAYLTAGALALGMGTPLIGTALDDGDLASLAARARAVMATVGARVGTLR
jgi:2-dehydro-3-deoxyphosphogluconate aldolase/(4S)-4-hydroxy-2-oxoglutarate aldolase